VLEAPGRQNLLTFMMSKENDSPVESNPPGDSNVPPDNVGNGVPAPSPTSPNPFAAFDPAKLRIDQAFLNHGVAKKLLTTLPIRKPSKQDFVRVDQLKADGRPEPDPWNMESPHTYDKSLPAPRGKSPSEFETDVAEEEKLKRTIEFGGLLPERDYQPIRRPKKPWQL
jgi:hypothetical protein